MSDEVATENTAEPEGKQEAPPKTFTQDQVNSFLADQKRKITSAYADYDQIKADAVELAKIREADKTELQKAQERAEAAEKRAVEAEFAALRGRVAASKGVPASSLTGTTEDELTASADELIAWRDQNAAKSPAPLKRPLTLKSGASGNDNNHDPKAAAVEALRRLRSG